VSRRPFLRYRPDIAIHFGLVTAPCPAEFALNFSRVSSELFSGFSERARSRPLREGRGVTPERRAER